MGCNSHPHSSAGEKSWILKFTGVSLSLVLLHIRKKGELSLGEASDIAPEKPEGTRLQEFSESHSCVLRFQTSFPLKKNLTLYPNVHTQFLHPELFTFATN